MLEAEQELVYKAQQGEQEAFGALYDHYLPRIYRYVLAKVSRREETEDLVHEVFLSAWQNIVRYRERGLPFSSWLYRIARNRVIDYYRLRKPEIGIDLIDPDAVKLATTIEAEMDTALAWNRVKGAMEELGETEQEVLLLRFVNDLNPREIAAILKKSEGAVRVMQHRAIQTLKTILHKEEPHSL